MQRTTRLSVFAVVALALVLRIAAAAYWQRAAHAEGHLFRLGDSHSYWTLASQIARGLPYEYGSADASIFRSPVYPLVLAPMTLIADEWSAVWAARMLGCLLGTLAVWLVMQLCKPVAEHLLERKWADRAVWCCGLMAAIYPGAIGMSIVILSEAIFCPLMLSYFLLWRRAWRSESWRTAMAFGVAAGGVAGLATLARPSWLLFVPFLFAIGVAIGPRRSRHATIFAATVMGLAMTMSPWWVRNASITGEFVLTTLQVGPSLYDGLHAGASGGSDEGMDFMSRFAAEQRAEDASVAEHRSTFEFRLNRRAQRAAVEWSRSNPGEVALLACRKFLRTWSLWPNGGDLGSGTLRLMLTIGCFSILVLAIVGSWRQEMERWSLAIYWLPAVYFTLLHMIFVGSIRYREPALLVLTILAGLGMAKLWKSFAKFAVGSKSSAAN